MGIRLSNARWLGGLSSDGVARRARVFFFRHYFQDAVNAEGAFGMVAVAVANEIIVVAAGFEEMGFDDAYGGFVGVGGIVGDGKRGLGLEGVLNLGEMF